MSNETLLQNRYSTCLFATTPGPLMFSSATLIWRLLCSDRGPSIGSNCATDYDCRPAPTGVAGRLACVAGRCAEGPRPEPSPEFGDLCSSVSVGISRQPNCDVCVHTAGHQQFCSSLCAFDEDCPAGFVCAYRPSDGGSSCSAACLPCGQRTAFSESGGRSDGGLNPAVDSGFCNFPSGRDGSRD